MMFQPPSWLPPIPKDLTTASTVGEFSLHGIHGAAQDEPITLVSAATQKTKTNRQLAEDVEALAAGLAEDLGWSPNDATRGGRVIAILCENSLDYVTYCWATHRLGASCLLLHASTVPAENAQHIKHSKCNTLILSSTLLEPGRAVVAAVGEANLRVYLTQSSPIGINHTSAETNGHHSPKTIDDLLTMGRAKGPLPVLDWSPEEAQSSIAYLCATSGTSGAQKLARLTHGGIITNILQLYTIERMTRTHDREIVLGITPLSHVQGVVAIHSSIFLRDRMILHSKFDMQAALISVKTHRINRLYVVPAILAALVSNPFLFKIFDLSSVDKVYVGSSILSAELYAKVKAAQPHWSVTVAYGMTESSVAIAMSSPHEYVPGSVGVLLPLYQARLLDQDGNEVEGFDEPGELLLSSPNQAQGYLGDNEASAATFRDGWLHTGDVAVFRQSPKGDSHLCIVDRLRDMIKVKGMQVSPFNIESCLRQHSGIADVAVIGVKDDLAGERPKAFIVPAKQPVPGDFPGEAEEEAAELFDALDEHVEAILPESHWPRGNYELLKVLPRTPTGKVSKGLLRATKRSKVYL